MVSTLCFYFLGTAYVDFNGETLAIKRRKAMALAAYILLCKGNHSREFLAGLLWPEYDKSNALGSLRRTLSELTGITGKSWLLIDRQTIAVNTKYPAWVDVSEFITAYDGITTQEPCGIRDTAKLKQADDLYRGDFLTGLSLKDAISFDNWQLEQTEHLRLINTQLKTLLITRHTQNDNLPAAISCAESLVHMDPFNENTHRQLIRLYAESGNPSQSIFQYKKCEALLKKELDITPEMRTVKLYQSIRDQSFFNTHHKENPSHSFTPSPLPPPASSFIGRKEELEIIQQYVLNPHCRLITLTGAGGMGKTQLALRVASAIHSKFTDGCCFVSLADIPASNHNAFLTTVSKAIFSDYHETNLSWKTIQSFLHNKQILLILDNFEHLIKEGCQIISELIEKTTSPKILITSRFRLMLSDEFPVPVQGLPYPESQTKLAITQKFDAIRLFIETGKRVQPSFSPTPSQLDEIIHICRLVDGMPLAIILAASWLDIFSCSKIITEITNHLDFLKNNFTDLPKRHHSIRAVVDSSWHLLSDEEKNLFMALSVFQNGFQAEAVSLVVQKDETSITPMLASLVRKSLLVAISDSNRFEMHMLLRQYTLEKLTQNKMDMILFPKHCHHYLNKLIGFTHTFQSKNLDMALEICNADFGNIRAAWLNAIERQDFKILLQSAKALYMYLDIQVRYLEEESLFLKALEMITDPTKNADFTLLYLCWFSGAAENENIDDARLEKIYSDGKQFLLLSERDNNNANKAYAKTILGTVDLLRDQIKKAIFYFKGAINDDPTIEDTFWVMLRIGICYRDLEKTDCAHYWFQKSLVKGKEKEDPVRIAWILNNISFLYLQTGRYDIAEQQLSKARRRLEIPNLQIAPIGTEFLLGWVSLSKGDLKKALSRSHYTNDLFRKKNRKPDGSREILILEGFIRIMENNHDLAESALQNALDRLKQGKIHKRKSLNNRFSIHLGFSSLAIMKSNYIEAKTQLIKAFPYIGKAQVYLLKEMMLINITMVLFYEGEKEKAFKILTFFSQKRAFTLMNQIPYYRTIFTQLSQHKAFPINKNRRYDHVETIIQHVIDEWQSTFESPHNIR